MKKIKWKPRKSFGNQIMETFVLLFKTLVYLTKFCYDLLYAMIPAFVVITFMTVINMDNIIISIAAILSVFGGLIYKFDIGGD